MKTNVYRFMDYAAEDALARLTEQAWQERRSEMLAERLCGTLKEIALQMGVGA